MGCDIHPVWEYFHDGAWKSIEDVKPVRHRCYDWFGVLAGVRRDMGDIIAKPRGFPTDAAPTNMREFLAWGIDAHSGSWVTLKELLAVPWRSIGLADKAEEYEKMQKDYDPQLLRMVFFFDN